MRAKHFLNVPTFIEENPEQSGGRESAIETEKLSMKKMISWNVNGLRACLGKGFLEYLKESDADIFCIQESKLQEGQVELELPGYHSTGITRRKRDIPVRRCLRRKNLFQ